MQRALTVILKPSECDYNGTSYDEEHISWICEMLRANPHVSSVIDGGVSDEAARNIRAEVIRRLREEINLFVSELQDG